MPRPAIPTLAALVGLLLAGCAGGGLGKSGTSLPTAEGDGVQTVSDAADALDAHRSSASESAKAAIGVTDALGAFVRNVIYAERKAETLHGARAAWPNISRTFSRSATKGGKQILSGSEVVVEPSLGGVSDFCESSAGYTAGGIPSLDVTFGWQSGAFSGGERAATERGVVTWSTDASGVIAQAAIGALTVAQREGSVSCPMTAAAYRLEGADVVNAYSLPLTIAFHHGKLWSLSVGKGSFADGESLEAASSNGRRGIQVRGIIRNGRTQLGTFHTDAAGNGGLTVTSTGAQYAIADWIVVGI